MESVPDDILAVIFDLVFCDCFGLSRDYPFKIMAVCKTWRLIVYNKVTTLGHRRIEFGNNSLLDENCGYASWNVAEKMCKLQNLELEIGSDCQAPLSTLMSLTLKPSITELELQIDTSQYNSSLALLLSTNLKKLSITHYNSASGPNLHVCLPNLKVFSLTITIPYQTKRTFYPRPKQLETYQFDKKFQCEQLESLEITAFNGAVVCMDCSLFPKLNSVKSYSCQIKNIDKCPLIEHIYWKQDGQNPDADFGLIHCRAKTKCYQVKRIHWDVIHLFPRHLTNINVQEIGSPDFVFGQSGRNAFFDLFPQWLLQYQTTLEKLFLLGIPFGDENSILEQVWIPAIVQLPLTHISLSWFDDTRKNHHFTINFALQVLTKIKTLKTFSLFGWENMLLVPSEQEQIKTATIKELYSLS